MQYLLILLLPLFLYASYVGDEACKECHSKEHKEWQGSHHDMAMKEATSKSVLGDFKNASYSINGITSSFYKRGEKFFIKTDGEDGKLHEYEVVYTFGIYPLQQYLLRYPDGKFQIPDIAWDSRKKEEGGQRWFHIHSKKIIKAGDVLHWSGPNFNWNFMCADCHSTNLKKNYNHTTKKYNTKFDSINVSCEACHGPASKHLEWAKNPKKSTTTLRAGLNIDLSQFTKKRWKVEPKSGKPKLLQEIDHSEVELCAKCHSRRSTLDDDFVAGDAYEDHYVPATLSDTLYFSDGKIKDEVYVYGSFKQSKMYEAGVTCSDCHNSHTLDRHAVGDNVCNQCHRRVDYDSHKHNKHSQGDASCIDCHMPSRTYMGVDERNDHSFRVPRPDLSVGQYIPNACNNCHKDKDAVWASESMKKWYGKTPKGKQNFSHSFNALSQNSENALQSIYDVLLSDAPTIVKATSVGHLGRYQSKQTYTTTLQMLDKKDASLRLNALRALESFPLRFRVQKTFDMLEDSAKMVRVEAARQLSFIPQGQMNTHQKKKLQTAIDEYEKTLIFNADRTESQTALGTLYSNLGNTIAAETAFKEALDLQSQYIPAYVNYAQYFQKRGNEDGVYKILKQGLKALPDGVLLHHTLGLHYIRIKEQKKALSSLSKAAELEVQNSRYQYVYAVALAKEDVSGAIKILENSLKLHTGDVETLFALSYYYKQLGDNLKAEKYEKKAEKISRFTPTF